MVDSNCYDFKTTRVTTSEQVPGHEGTFGFIVINQGDTGVTVQFNNMQFYLKPYPPLRPDLVGSSLSYVDAQGKILKGNFRFIFDAAPGAFPFVELHIVHHK